MTDETRAIQAAAGIEDEFRAAMSYVPCGLLMVGSGGDTYDPICDLREGHDGACKSTAAIDQHRLDAYPPGHPRSEGSTDG